MYARPKPGETEEDLLCLQEEFQKQKAENKIKPAATVVSNKIKEDETESKSSMEISKADINEQLANTFEAIPTDMQLKGILEKREEITQLPPITFQKAMGFPKAKRRDLTITSGGGSIFAQQLKRAKTDNVMKKKDICMEVDIVISKNDNAVPFKATTEFLTRKQNLPSKSYILTGSDSHQIHEENLNIIRSMAEEEIIEEREKIMTTMDPAIIAYLKSRRKKVLQNHNPTIKEQNETANDINLEELESPSEILTNPKAEKWLNFDVIEANKLAWMKNINIPQIKKSDKFEARFDFEGWVLPYSEPEINEKNRILYHHGEEPGRPGYTLQELFQLARSSVFQQKILALNTIGNILSLYSTGVYDDILDLPMEQIFFVIRFCLDDNTPAVLNASIKAIRNVFLFQVDEVCLDSLLGFDLGLVQPTLAVDNDLEYDNTVNDQQLAEKNLVKCLARTEILTRIRYIINTIHPPIETIVYCMDILTRLARDSDFISNKILTSEGLLDSIIKNFVPLVLNPDSSTTEPLPLLQAVKLLRVLSSRSKTVAVNLVKKHKIMDSVITYLSNDKFSMNTNGLRLQTECMHYWSLLLHYGIGLDYFRVLHPVLMNILDYHFKNTIFHPKTTFVRHEHLAALLILLKRVTQQNYTLIAPFVQLLQEQCLPKWSAQFRSLSKYPCGKLQVLAALVLCLSSLRAFQRNAVLDDAIQRIIQSEGFSNITADIRSGSMLLNNYETHKSSSNIKSLEAAAWHTMDHIVPIIQTNSCLPFLYSFSEYVKVSNSRKLKITFLTHKNIQLYLTSLQKLEKYYLTNNWFARPESMILINVLKISVAVKDDIDTSLFYELAVKCLSVFNSEQKPDIEFLFENIIFCSKFYPSDILMQNLDISERSTNLETSLENLGEIMRVYTLVLGLKDGVPDYSTCCCLDIGIGNVIPIDWIYTPILILYSNQLQNKSNVDEEQQIFTVRNCLRWILIYETYFPFLASTINPTDKFCRLACVFLGSDNLFLTKEIHDLLELCFKNVINKSEGDLNFKREIQGLSNFQDFYTQLLEQYQSVSYGDVLFGNIILVPLAQKHNIQYRKTLWSEYIGVAQIFNVTPEECICDVNSFLDPPEQDMSLLKCYRRALVQNILRNHSVLFRIANNHVEKFIERQKKT